MLWSVVSCWLHPCTGNQGKLSRSCFLSIRAKYCRKGIASRLPRLPTTRAQELQCCSRSFDGTQLLKAVGQWGQIPRFFASVFRISCEAILVTMISFSVIVSLCHCAVVERVKPEGFVRLNLELVPFRQSHHSLACMV